MSIDKWLSKKGSKEEEIKREQAFKKLSKEEIQSLKKKKVRDIVQKKPVEKKDRVKDDYILHEIIEFKNWLNNRTYLKGDLDKIEVQIKNLYSKIMNETAQKLKITELNNKHEIIKQYNEVPPNFIDEKMRIAINKKLRGGQKTSSDNYYIRKLRKIIKDKLAEARYYEILDKILKV